MAFGLFPSPCRLSCFCFAFNAYLVFFFQITVFEDSFAVTGATQMAVHNLFQSWFLQLKKLAQVAV